MSLARALAQPLDDAADAIDGARRHRHGARSALLVLVSAIACWFVYVPVHELLHALGCIAMGGTVTRLEIAPEYGGALLARFIPFVAAGSAYAGQLTGFDTFGSDAVYLVTVLAPYSLTIAIGVPLLLHSARTMQRPVAGPLRFGAALPIAYAPFVSLIGDYYEAGSIIASRAAHATDAALPLARWRSDDVFKLIATLHGDRATGLDWTIVAGGVFIGTMLAFVTYHLGRLCARRFVRDVSTRPTRQTQ